MNDTILRLGCSTLGFFRIFRNLPIVNKAYHWWLKAKFDIAFLAFRDNTIGSLLRRMLQRSVKQYMKRMTPHDYHDILTHSYAFGSKRPVMDHDYLQSLRDDRVLLTKSKSLRVTGQKQLSNENDAKFSADIIILANGDRTQQLLTPLTIVGLDGVMLPDWWY